ncbi:hypothetical protein AB1Y20_014407 [Prymnesium parvum]|uniref:Uncharacterized protein n=1 Tax=Prymnesium parvum TaxID=97485 RepID=A0AB34IG70_PRYPA
MRSAWLKWAEGSARRVVALGVLRRGLGALVHHAMWRSFRRLEEALLERTAESVVLTALSRLRHRLDARALSQWAWATLRQLEVVVRRRVAQRRWAGRSLVWSIRRWGERTRRVRELRAVIGRSRLRVGSAALHTWAERSARRVVALGVLRRGLGALVHHAMWRSFRRLEEAVHERTAESVVQAALSRLRHRLEARALSQWAWATRRQLEVAERRETPLRRWAGHSLVWSIRRWGERTRGVRELRAVIGRWRLRVGSAALHTWAERSARRVGALGVLRRGLGALVHHAMWRSFRRLEEAVHERTAESVVQAALSRLRHRLEARALSQWAWATRRQLEVAERREVSLHRWAGHSLVWSIRRWGERTRGVLELRAVIGRWRLRVGSAALHTWAERSARRVGALGVLRRGVGALVHHAMWRSFRRLEEAVHERTAESAVQAALSRLRHREEARALSQWAWATRRQLEVAERREVSLRRWAGHSLVWSIRRWGERTRGVRELRAVIGRWRLRVGSAALHTWAERSARRVVALGVLRRGVGALVHHAMWRSFRRFEEAVHERTAESVVQAALSRLRHRLEARALSQWAWATRRQLEVGREDARCAELRAVIGRWRLRVGSAALHTWAERSARRVVALGVLRRGVGALVHHAMWRSFRRLEEAVHEHTAESAVQAALSRLRHREEARALSQWAWATRRQLEVAERREVSLRRWAGHSLVWSIRRWGERTRGVRELRAVIGRWRLRMGSAALRTWAERSARRVGALGVLRRGVGALVHHAMWRSFRRLEEAVHERTAESAVQAALSRLRHRLEARALSQWAWATRRQLEVAERREVSLRRWAGHSLVWSIRRWGERTRGVRELRAVIGRWRLRVGSAALHTWAERSARRVVALGVLRRGVGALVHHAMWRSFRRLEEAVHERTAESVVQAALSRLRHRLEARALSQWAWATRRQLEVAERREVSLRRWAGHSLVWSIRRWGERTRGVRELRAVIGRWRLRVGSAALHTWAERSARRVGALGVLRRGVGALVHHAMWRSFRRLEEAVHERTAESAWAWATRRQLEVAERREVPLRRWAGHSLVWSIRRWGERTRGVRELRAVIGRWRLRVGSAALHTWAERSARRVVALGVLRRGVGALVHHAMWRSFRRLEEAAHERTAESVVQAALSRLRHRLEARALSQWAWATRRQLEVAERREVSLRRWAGHSLVWSIQRGGERTRGVRELRAVIGRWRLRVGSEALHTWAKRSARRVGALGVLRRGVGALVHHAMWRSFRRLEEAVHERTEESAVQAALSRLRHREEARALSQWAWATRRQLEVAERREVSLRRWAGHSLLWSIRRWGERARGVRELRAVIGRWRLRVGSTALRTWAERSARRVGALGVLRRGLGALVHHAMWRSFRRFEEAVHERTAESVVQAALSRLRHRVEARALSQWAWATRRQLEVAERREVPLRRWAGHSLVWSIRRWGERTRGVLELRAVIGRWRLRVGSAALHTWAERSARRVVALGVLRRGVGALVHHAMWRSFRRLEEAVHEHTAESAVQAALSRLRHREEARALSQWAWATRRQLEVAERREVSLRRWAGHSLVWSIRRWGERTRGVRELRAVIGRWRLRMGSAALHTWAERSARRVGALGVLRRGVGALVHHAMWRSFRRLEEAVHERTAESAVQAALSRLRHRLEARALSQWAWATRRQLEVAERREVSLRRWAGHSLLWSIRRWGERTRGLRELRAVIGRWRLRVGSAALHTWAERSARRVGALGVLRRGVGALVHHAMWRSFRRLEEAVHERTAESVVQAALSRLRHRLEARALSQWAWATRRQLEVAERREVSLRRWAGHSLVWSIRRWGERTRGVRELRAVIGRWRLRVGSAALHTWAERSARRVGALGVLRRGLGALVHHAMWRSFRRLEEVVHERTAESAVQAALSRLRHRLEARALSQWAWATRRQLEVAERREVSLRRWAGHSLVWSIRRWGERTRGVRELRAVIGRWRLRVGSAALHTWAERSARRVVALGVLRRGVGALVHHAMWRSFRRLEEAVHERTAESVVQAALSRLRHRLEARALSQWAWATRRQLEVAERREVSLRRWAGHSLVWSIRRWGERTRGVRELRAVIGRWRLRVGSAALHTWAERSARRVGALGVLRRGVGALVHHAMWRSFRRLEEAVHERTEESAVQAALSRLRHREEARALSQWAWATRRQLEVAERREVSLRRWAGHSLLWSIRRWGERARGVRELRAVIGRWRLRVGSTALRTWAERSARRVGALGVLRRGLGALVHHAMWRSFRRFEETVHERTAESVVQAALSRLRHRVEARALSQWAWATRRQLEVAERREVPLRRWAGHSLVWSIRRWGERTRGVRELRAVIGRWRLRVGSAALHTWAERSARRVGALGVLRRGVGALVHHAMWRSFRRLEEAAHERTAESVVQAALSRLRHRLEARALSQWAWATRRQLEVAERREVSLRRWAGHSLVWSIRRWGERTRGVRELRAVIGRWRLRMGSAALHTWAERSARRVGALGVLRRGVGALVHHAMWRSFRRLEEAVHERTAESAVQAALSRLRHRLEARALSQWAWATRRQLEVAERREVSLRRWAGHSLVWSIRRWGERTRGLRELRAVIGRWRLRVGSAALHTWAERSARRVGALGVLRRGVGALVHHAMWRSFRRLEEAVHERTAESVVQAALSRLRHRLEARALSQWAWATRRQLEVAERREVSLRRWAGHSLVWSIRRWGERTRGVRELRAVIGRWRLRVGSAALHTWAERSARRVGALGVLRRGVGALEQHAMQLFRRLEEAVHERTAESVVQAALSRLRHREEARALSQWAWATRRQLEVAERREVSLRRWAGHSLLWSIRRWGERTRGVRELRAVIGRWRLRVGSAALHTWAERSARRVVALGVLRRGVGALVHHAMWHSFRRLEEAVHERTAESVVQAALSRLRHREETRALSQWAWATRRQLEVAERREVSLRRWAGHSLVWSIRRWGERTRGVRELRAVIGRWRLRVGSAALHTWAERSARRVGALGVLRRGVGALVHHAMWRSFRRLEEAVHERTAESVVQAALSRLRHRLEARALSQWAWATRRQLEVAERREVSLHRWAGHSLVWSIRRWGERTRGVRELRAVIGRWRLRVGSTALRTWAERSARRVGALGVLRRGLGALVHHAMWRSFRRLEETVHERTAESVVQAALSRLRHREETRALSQWAWATRRQLEVGREDSSYSAAVCCCYLLGL